MSKLYLNSDPVYKVVLPSIRSSINSLNKAINSFNTSNVPNEFSNKAFSNRNAMMQIKKDLENLEMWLNSSVRQFDDLEVKMSQLANSLPIDDIPIRRNRVG